LWQLAQKEHGLKGLKAKNSFLLGVAEGFDQKMKLTKKNYSAADQQALVVVEQKLNFDTQAIYRRLAHSRSGHQTDRNAGQLGHAQGLSLTIRNAVTGKGKNLYLSER
jgi:hypothetical protein